MKAMNSKQDKEIWLTMSDAMQLIYYFHDWQKDKINRTEVKKIYQSYILKSKIGRQ